TNATASTSPRCTPSTMERSLCRPVSISARSSNRSSSRLRMVAWASLTRTSVAPPEWNPAMAALTSEVNIDRQRCHCSVPGSTSAGQVTPVAPSMSAEIRTLTGATLSRAPQGSPGPHGPRLVFPQLPSAPPGAAPLPRSGGGAPPAGSGQGEDLRTVLGDHQGVLELRGPLAVRGDRGPAVVPHVVLDAAQGDHRLD